MLLLGFFLLLSVVHGATMWYNTSQAVSTDTTGVWQLKVPLTWNVADASKTYRLDWTYSIKGSIASHYAHVRVRLDVSDTLSDTWWQNVPDAAVGWGEVSGFVMKTGLSVGPHVLELHYTAADSTQSVSIKTATLVAWEVNV
jgi:hypothetical protein